LKPGLYNFPAALLSLSAAMEKLNKTGQVFFGICLAGLGLQQFIYPGFRPFLIPEWPAWIPGHASIWVYLTGAALIFVGLAIIINWKAITISWYTGLVFLLVLILFHLSYRFKNNPESLGAWTNELKLLGFAGSCFITAASFQAASPSSRFVRRKWVGEIFLAIMYVIFGIDHFLYAEFVKSLVPAWIPGSLFWTYIAGIALIASGLAIGLNFNKRLAAILLGCVLLIWFLVLHIPRAIDPPPGDNGNELTSVFQCLGLSGVSFMIARMSRK
jgi:uncharacterized membrane protein